ATLDSDLGNASSNPLQGATLRALITPLGEIRDFVMSAPAVPGFSQSNPDVERGAQEMRATLAKALSLPVAGFAQDSRDTISMDFTADDGRRLTLRLDRTAVGLGKYHGRAVVVCTYGKGAGSPPTLTAYSGFALLDVQTGATLVWMSRYSMSGVMNGKGVDI